MAANDAIGPKPTELFYALYLHAQYPEGFTLKPKVKVQIRLHSKDSQEYTEALADYEKTIRGGIEQYPRALAAYEYEKEIPRKAGQHVSLFSLVSQEKNRLKALVDRYSQKPTGAEEKDELEPPAPLEGELFQNACAQNFESLYDSYQGLIFEEENFEDAQSQPIPVSLKTLVAEWSLCESTPNAAMEIQGLELENPDDLLKGMSALSGLEEDFLESLCRMSGGLESSLLGVFEAKKVRGDGVSEELRTREGLQGQLQSICQEIDSLYSRLPSEDRGHTALREPFEGWLIAQSFRYEYLKRRLYCK